MTRLLIDIINGILEVEGEEEFVNKIYNDYKDNLASLKNSAKTKVAAKEAPQEAKRSSSTKKRTSISKKPKSNNIPSYVKDLDLTKGDREKSLKEYYKEKGSKSYAEKNLVFVAYLEEIANIKGIGLNHIYTCYRDVNSRIPTAFKQSIADTSSKKGWLNTTSFEDIKLSILGKNYVLQDLPQETEKTAPNDGN